MNRRRPQNRQRLLVAAACAVVWAGGAAVASAADEAVVLRLRAVELSSSGRCEEAVEVARQAAEMAPDDPELARVEGFCLAQLGRYREALPALERLAELAPQTPGLALRRGVAHYQLEEFDAAGRHLARATDEDPENAEALFYRGLLELRDASDASAAALLERSVALDPDGIGAAGSYYAGLAWERARDDAAARRALEEVIRDAPGTTWATRAQAALSRINLRTRTRRWARATIGMEWDDNAVLRGAGVDLPSEISSDNDWRGVWRLEAGQELLRGEQWTGGVVAGYQGYAYTDLDDFNLHYPTASLWLDRRLGERSFVRVMPNFGYGWRDQDDYLLTYGVSAALHHRFETAGSGRAFVRFDRMNLLFDLDDNPFTPANEATLRNRDGNRLTLGVDHRYAVDDKTTLRGGFSHERYDARGREYSFLGYEPWIGVSRDLFFELTAHVRGSYQYRAYRHPSTFFDPGDPTLSRRTRKENDFGVEVALERRITDSISASVRWRYRDNASNRDVFDYERHRIGAFITVAWSN